MKIAIMQPYLFPYLGYFQLIHSVDVFVLHDDVQWIKGGWINRNRILLQGKPLRWTLPIAKKNSTDLIKRCEVAAISDGKKRILRQVENAYKRAPYFSDVISLVTNIINHPEKNVAIYIRNSIDRIVEYMQIEVQLLMSSSLNIDGAIKGQERVINICSVLGAKTYINPPGGVELYDKKEFKKAGIDLNFLSPGNIFYQQFDNAFVPNLSVIDALMFNSNESIRKMLSIYTLI